MNRFSLTGEYPPHPGGVADHTACLVQELAELALVPVVLSGGDAGLSVENGTPVYRVGRSYAPVHLRYLARALDAFRGPRVIFIQLFSVLVWAPRNEYY
jgi:hypothetical protein